MKKLIITLILLASLTAGLFALPNLLKKEQFGANAIDNIDIDLSWEDIVVKETYDNSGIDVEIYSNYKKYSPDVSVSGSTLYIESVKRSFGFVDLAKNPTGTKCTVILYVPQKKDFDEIEINTSSGEIKVERILSAKSKISLKASSGNITSNNGLFADDLKVEASSGDIELYNIDADDFSVQTSSGNIQVEKFTGGTGSLQASSGDIKSIDFASEYAKFNTSSGSISIKKFDCDYFDAQSSSGNITLDFKNAPAATSSVRSTSGDVDIYLPMRAKFSVDVSCTSGTFRDKFNNNRMNPRNSYHMDYNGGGPDIQIRTTSGDITLEY
jgi:DUF4097 and DUF4098 domain-containing protein YvlB